MNTQRIVFALLGIIALYYTVEGGEYSAGDLLTQRARRKQTLARIDSLRHVIDSLEKLKKQLATDAALQERIARENWSMVKGEKELIYRFLPPGKDAKP